MNSEKEASPYLNQRMPRPELWNRQNKEKG